MPLYVYGDVTVDNYEYFGRFYDTYKKLFKSLDPKGNPPELNDEASHRIVARALGGAFSRPLHVYRDLALAQQEPHAAHPNPKDRRAWFKRLDQLQPWANRRKRLHDQNSHYQAP